MWRGEPLADFAYERFAQGEIARLEQARLGALEDRIDAELALGEQAGLVGSSRRWSPSIRRASACSRSADGRVVPIGTPGRRA